MSIDYVVAVNACCVAVNFIFGDGVLDCNTVFILVKTGESPFPTVSFGYHLAVNLFTVREKVDGDAFRSQTVMVFFVFPSFEACNVDQFINNLGFREDQRIAVITLAVLGIQNCRVIGRNNIAAGDFSLFGQLQLIGKRCFSCKRNVFTKCPNEFFGNLTIAVVIVEPECRFVRLGSSEFQREVCTVSCIDLSGCIGLAANGQSNIFGILNKFIVTGIFIITDIVFYIRSNGTRVEKIFANGVKEVFVKNFIPSVVSVLVVLKLPYCRSFFLTCQLSQVIHEGVTQHGGRTTGITSVCNVGGVVLVVSSFAADGVATVSCIDQFLPNLNALILCTFIVQCM